MNGTYRILDGTVALGAIRTLGGLVNVHAAVGGALHQSQVPVVGSHLADGLGEGKRALAESQDAGGDDDEGSHFDSEGLCAF